MFNCAVLYFNKHSKCAVRAFLQMSLHRSRGGQDAKGSGPDKKRGARRKRFSGSRYFNIAHLTRDKRRSTLGDKMCMIKEKL